MNREIKFEIMLRALENTKSGHKKGDEVKMINDIFCRKNGVAFWQIGLEWEILYQRQYTGLKDRNGVEIYEGDILTAHYNDERPKPSRIVWYFKPRSAFVNTTIAEYKKYQLDKSNDTWIYNTAHAANWGWGNIIGNIHQNPELLS